MFCYRSGCRLSYNAWLVSELHSFSRDREFPKYYFAYCECIVQGISEDQFSEGLYLLCMPVFSALNRKRETMSKMLLPCFQALTLCLQEPLIPGQEVWCKPEKLFWQWKSRLLTFPESPASLPCHIKYMWSIHMTKEGLGNAVLQLVFFLAARKILSSLLFLLWVRGAPRRGGSQEWSSGWINRPVGSFEAQRVLLERGRFCWLWVRLSVCF